MCNGCSPHSKTFEDGSHRICLDCEQKETLMREVKQYKNQTMKQRKDYESKHAVLKKELTEMENVLEEEKISKE